MDGIGLLNLARCVASNLVQEDVELGVIEVKEFRKIDESCDVVNDTGGMIFLENLAIACDFNIISKLQENFNFDGSRDISRAMQEFGLSGRS
ncbi:hypothetical protein V6N12_007683 [Hibiscus sabdariffa]|uniref:Uncharacterized protein n=1 Tax=Hibiscus sabdariffa TaxID=183260 RepID=A0ABR2F2H5_9ROSI